MPRKVEIPSSELAICHRLRAFRENTGIARTVFSSATGLIGVRLDNCEAGRTPVNFGVFIGVHRRFLVSPKWLVTGEGSPALAVQIEPCELNRAIPDREWLSAAYERTLGPYLESRSHEALEFWTGPGGFAEKAAELVKELSDPKKSAKYPANFLRKLEHDLFMLEVKVCRALKEDSRLAWLAEELRTGKKRKP